MGGEEVGDREVGVTHPPRGEGAASFPESLCRDAARSVVAARLLEQHSRQVQYSLSQSVAEQFPITLLKMPEAGQAVTPCRDARCFEQVQKTLTGSCSFS